MTRTSSTKLMCLPGQAEIERQVLAYLAEHPGAQDTFRGIVEWWLVDRKIRYQIALVRAALKRLVRKQLLVEHRDRAMDPEAYRYEVNQAKQKEIKEVLGH